MDLVFLYEIFILHIKKYKIYTNYKITILIKKIVLLKSQYLNFLGHYDDMANVVINVFWQIYISYSEWWLLELISIILPSFDSLK